MDEAEIWTHLIQRSDGEDGWGEDLDPASNSDDGWRGDLGQASHLEDGWREVWTQPPFQRSDGEDGDKVWNQPPI